MKQKLSPCMPAIFCAFLSLIVLSVQMGSDSGAWKPAFDYFLLLCFFLVGTATSRMHGDIREIRRQLTELREKRVG